MKTGICYVVGAGGNYGLDFAPDSNDCVIAADAGFQVLEQIGIKIDMVIGDFDTLNRVPIHPNVIVLNKEKDTTDMLSAVREGIKMGYEVFHIYCGTGGRVEHTIANMQLLTELSQSGKHGYLFGKDYVITAITNETVSFSKEAVGFVSVFSHSDQAEGVFLKGLKYELDNAVLSNNYPLGVSNEFIGEKSRISVKNGTLMLVFPRAVKELPLCHGNPVPERLN
ncbi:MAG: thiamine diphosphokinase [Lachnospiraceae bacterium]|nr:thiamine diphosphokinase [Lachnospiraceae bacterium]